MKKELRALIEYDVFRNTGKKKISFFSHFLNPNLKFLKLFRCAQSYRDNPLLLAFYKLKLHFFGFKYFIQIPWNTKIGRGLFIGHTGRIIVNSRTVIGDNVNLATGITIGQTNRGEKKGTPTIGNCVWIGTNVVIVGNISIGNDVLIAPNSYVNVNIPDHSIVIGNPAVIIQKDNATEGYINNVV